MTITRQPAGIPTGGQFSTSQRAAHHTTEIEMGTPSAPVPKYVSVMDATGAMVELQAGVIDAEARWVYMNGQCLALAIAISEETGWPIHLSTIQDCAGPLDDQGRASIVSVLRHASVATPDGDLLDISGPNDPDVIEVYEGDGAETVPAAEADQVLAEFAPYLTEQDVPAAKTFVQAVLDQNSCGGKYPPVADFADLAGSIGEYDPSADVYRDPSLKTAQFRYIHRYPLTSFSPTEPHDFVAEMDYDDDSEAEEDIDYYDELRESLRRDPDSAGPLIIDESFALAPTLDGNHRGGPAASAGLTHLPAYVRVA